MYVSPSAPSVGNHNYRDEGTKVQFIYVSIVTNLRLRNTETLRHSTVVQCTKAPTCKYDTFIRELKHM